MPTLVIEITHPLAKLVSNSLLGPSPSKLVIANQLVLRLSFGPLFVATLYFTISCPVLVACTSGVSARRPIMEMRASWEEGVVLKARVAGRAKRALRRANILLAVVKKKEA